MTLVTLGYSIAAFAYAGMAVFLLAGRSLRWPFNYLVALAGIMAAWGVGMALTAGRGMPLGALVAIDGLHAFAILLFLGQLIQRHERSGWRRSFALLPWLIPLVSAFIGWRTASDQTVGFQFAYYFIVAISLLGLLAVEQVYRNPSLLNRRVASLVAVSFGAVFVFDLFTYANLLMAGRLDAQIWAARGFVNAIVVLPLLLALKRNPDWEAGLFVSRQVVFYSASLIGVGAYLMLVAFGSLFMQRLGGDWGGALRIVFLSASIILLVLMLFSQQLRRRLKVFLATHFYANRYDYREEWMTLIRRLAQDSARAPMPDLCLDSLVGILDSDGGALWLREPDTGVYRRAASAGEGQAPERIAAEHPIVAFLEHSGWVLDDREAQKNPKAYRDALDDAEARDLLADRIIVPVVLDDALTGFAAINRPAGLPDLNYEDHDLFRTVGRQLAVFLEQSRIQRDLTQARQFEVFNKFSAYVMHDLKNLIAQQSLVVANAKRHKDDPEFIDDAIATIDNSVKRMRRLLGQLESGRAGETTRSLDLVTLLEKVCADVSDRQPEPRLANEAGDDPMPVFGDGERLGSALQHLLRNAQDATPVDGEIVVTLRAEPGAQDTAARARIDIQDSGAGMTREFIDTKLFEPFVSTKGAQGMGIGVFQARDAVQSFGGVVTVDSAPGKGTTFIVSLPLLASLQEASG